MTYSRLAPPLSPAALALLALCLLPAARVAAAPTSPDVVETGPIAPDAPHPATLPAPATLPEALERGDAAPFHVCGTGHWHVRDRAAAADAGAALARLVVVAEQEPNDTTTNATSTPLGTGGAGSGQDASVDMTGAVPAPLTPTSTTAPEPNDSIGTAIPPVFVGQQRGAWSAAGTIGDGAFGTTSGDFDFYRISAAAGQTLFIEVRTPQPLDTDLDPLIGLYDSAGTLIAGVEDISGSNFDARLEFVAPANGDYYACIAGFRNVTFAERLPADPFTPGTGRGVGSTGTYTITIGLDDADIDWFSAELRGGDILGVAGNSSATRLTLVAADGTRLMTSAQNAGSIFPTASTLPRNGTSLLHYVIPATGTYFIGATGRTAGSYSLNARVFRPAFEARPELTHQYLFLDFDGASVNAPALFGGGNNPANLTPLSNFIAGWGLAGQEAALIDAITARVQAIMDDVAAAGNNGSLRDGGAPGSFRITVLNSKDHPDLFGQPNVSRVVVGGTIAQLGISTIGIAESIDVGNFEAGETAVVLLDLLSGSSGSANSLNQFAVAAGASKIDLVAAGVGNIVAHEAAHFFGCWHTDQFNATPCIIDQGGNLANSVGVGADRTWGTSDDRDVLNVIDTFNPNEGFGGAEDTRNAIAFGLASGTTPGAWVELVDRDLFYSGARGAGDAVEVDHNGVAGVVVLRVEGAAAVEFGQISSATVLGLGGDDTITVTAHPTVPVLADGGEGNDLFVFDADGTATSPAVSVIPSGFLDAAGRQRTTYREFERLVVPIELSGVTVR